ncbi:MAG: YdcF family protein [Bacteroidota bacterium]
MYFIFSKILLFILLPVYWVIALLAIGLVVKNPKRKKRFLIAGFVMLYLCSAPLFLKSFQYVWDVKPYPANDTTKYSCVIVLGGFSSGGGEDGGHFNSSADRFIQGAKLMETKQASHILISGGTGELIPGAFREAAWVRTQLLKFNVPDSAILVENNSKNTIENARFSKALLQQMHLPPPYLLVTSSYHMRRSLMIFKKAGVPVVPYTCNYLYGNLTFGIGDLLPEGHTIAKWESYTKEIVGYTVNYFN